MAQKAADDQIAWFVAAALRSTLDVMNMLGMPVAVLADRCAAATVRLADHLLSGFRPCGIFRMVALLDERGSFEGRTSLEG